MIFKLNYRQTESRNATSLEGKALSRCATEGLRDCADDSGPALRGQRSLEMFSINTLNGSLSPGHLWPFRSVHLEELRFCRASGQHEKSGALNDVPSGRLGPLLNLLWCVFPLRLSGRLKFLLALRG